MPVANKTDQIVDAAKATFLTVGYRATSMDLIAERANVTKRTIYNNFKSKEQLLEAVIEGTLARLSERLAPLPADAGQPKLLRFAETLIELICWDGAIGVQRLVIADSDCDSDGIGDVFLARFVEEVETRARPRLANGEEKSIPLRRRLEAALATRCHCERKAVDLGKPLRMALEGAAIRGTEQDRIVMPGAALHKRCQPVAQLLRIADIARLVRPFKPVRIGKGADRKHRREPHRERQLQFAHSAPACTCASP